MPASIMSLSQDNISLHAGELVTHAVEKAFDSLRCHSETSVVEDNSHPTPDTIDAAKSLGSIQPSKNRSLARSLGAVEPNENAQSFGDADAESLRAAERSAQAVIGSPVAAAQEKIVQESPPPPTLRAKTTRNRSLSLAEIGPPEKRPDPNMCSSCDESRRRKFGHASRAPALPRIADENSVTIADLDLGLYNLANPYDTKVVVDNNKILKMHGLQVVEAMEPESLVADYDFLREKVMAQSHRIHELERTLHNVSGDVTSVHQQTIALQNALREQERYSANFYSALQTTTEERNAYRDEAARNEVLLKEYEAAALQMQQRIRMLENGVCSFQTRPPQPQQQQQQRNYPYSNNPPATGRGDVANPYDLYNLPCGRDMV